MTPQEFINNWKNVALTERSASQSHFIALCSLLGIDPPVKADPIGDWFTFEKGTIKASGGKGWADVWRKECFAWEYKGKHADLDAAMDQLMQYAVALENPPLLIVSDMNIIRITTNWNNTVQKVHTINLDDLTDIKNIDLLRNAFDAPEQLKPTKTRRMVTEQAAANFTDIAQRLRDRGYPSEEVAHFINRLVFCMFAEDVNLLPNKLFEELVQKSRSKPGTFATHAKELFGKMKTGGHFGLELVERFNGGLFDNDDVLPLEWQDLDDLLRATSLDWSDIDPSIFGTLFERGLDPNKRSQVGAHYTDSDKIMQIVGPVIVDPLLAEWAEVKKQIKDELNKAPKIPVGTAQKSAKTRAFTKAEKLHFNFISRLKAFRVLDPACGSGNFLYTALLELKNIEHRANLEAEVLGLQKGFPQLGPEVVLGIELSGYAVELARVSVWIGEIQWMRRNGFQATKNPILRTLDTIENRDAVLADDGTRAKWPKADVVIGNPPFKGDRKMIKELGEDYTAKLRKAYGKEIPGGSNLVCYWFSNAWQKIKNGELISAGLISTNAIRGGANRAVLKTITQSGRISWALSDEAWTVDGAAVRVSLVCFDKLVSPSANLDGTEVKVIYPDLTSNDLNFNLTLAKALNENQHVCFIGTQKNGPFDLPGTIARKHLQSPLNPNGRSNSDVIFPWSNGIAITKRDPDKWVIDFGATMEKADAALYEAPFEHVVREVKPTRDKLRRDWHRLKWWLHGDPRPAQKKAVSMLNRMLASPRVSKFRLFVWRPAIMVPDSAIVVIARDDDTTFGILHSTFHELWALRMGTFLGKGNDPRYTPTTTFETFPFPDGFGPNVAAVDYAAEPRAIAIATAAARLNQLRENWLNPNNLVDRVPEVVAGYPDRLLPKDKTAEAQLQERTLTNLYNTRPTWLDDAHKTLDKAVAEAYGWGDDWRTGVLTEDEILARLFNLNQTRAKAEAKSAKKAKAKTSSKPKKTMRAHVQTLPQTKTSYPDVGKT